MSPTDIGLRRYLEATAAIAFRAHPRPGNSYTSTYDYVLDRGTFEVSRPLASEQASWLAAVLQGTRAQWRECFMNAQLLADAYPDRLTYREGFAVSLSGFPCLHGWCVLDGTHVVDVTWRTKLRGAGGRRIRGVFPHTWSYLGVTIQNQGRHASRAIQLGAWSSYIDSWEERFPLLHEPRLAPPKWEPLPELPEATVAFG